MNCVVKVICVPLERVIGLKYMLLFVLFRRGMKSTSVFDFLFGVPVCIWIPNRLRWLRVKFAALVASSRVGRMKELSST